MTLSAARRAAHTRFNFEGNTVDESGGSWYVVASDGTRIAGPFASAPHARTVQDRLSDQWPDANLEYDL